MDSYFCTNQAPVLLIVCGRPAVEAIFIRFPSPLRCSWKGTFLYVTFSYILQSDWCVLKDLAFLPECNDLDIWKTLFSVSGMTTHGDSC